MVKQPSDESVIGLIIPSKVEDSSETITKAKLFVGFGVGIWLISIASLLGLGFGTIYFERIGSLSVSDATIIFLIGTIFIWFTLTKIGGKQEQ